MQVKRGMKKRMKKVLRKRVCNVRTWKNVVWIHKYPRKNFFTFICDKVMRLPNSEADLKFLLRTHPTKCKFSFQNYVQLNLELIAMCFFSFFFLFSIGDFPTLDVRNIFP